MVEEWTDHMLALRKDTVGVHQEQKYANAERVLRRFAREFARVLSAERRRHGLSQIQLARLLGKHQSFIARLERPKEDSDVPSLRTMVEVLLALGKSPEFFTSEEVDTVKPGVDQSLQWGLISSHVRRVHNASSRVRVDCDPLSIVPAEVVNSWKDRKTIRRRVT